MRINYSCTKRLSKYISCNFPCFFYRNLKFYWLYLIIEMVDILPFFFKQSLFMEKYSKVRFKNSKRSVVDLNIILQFILQNSSYLKRYMHEMIRMHWTNIEQIHLNQSFSICAALFHQVSWIKGIWDFFTLLNIQWWIFLTGTTHFENPVIIFM